MSAPRVRVLPCDRCGDAMLRDGKLYTMGRPPFGKFPLKVYCARCKRTTFVQVGRWATLKMRNGAAPMPVRHKDEQGNFDEDAASFDARLQEWRQVEQIAE